MKDVLRIKRLRRAATGMTLAAGLAMGQGMCSAATGSALSPVPITVVPALKTSPPRLDGKLDDAFWKEAADTGPFLSADGSVAPRAATYARLARTPQALWIAVDCAEPRMDRLTVRRTERDSAVWTDDCIEVFVQAPGRPYLHFVVNPRGTMFDERERDARWNGRWSAAAFRATNRWSVELRLPWSTLGATPAEVREWRVNVCRSRRARFELSAWSATGGGFHEPDRFARILCVEGPWATGIRWRFVSRRELRADVDWAPAGAAGALKVRINGRLGLGPYRIEREGRIPVLLEARRAGRVVLRAATVAALLPVDAALAAAAARLKGIENATETVGEARQRLRRRIEALRSLVRDAPPDLERELVREARCVEAEASYLRAKAAVAAAGAAPDGIVYGIASSLQKLLPGVPFDGAPGGALELDAARREMDAGQVVLFAFDAPLTSITVKVSDARGPGGNTLAAAAFRVRRVGLVRTVRPVYRVEHVGLWPDPLLPFAPFDVAAGGFVSLWVDARVPPGTPPGIYHGKLTLDALNARPTVVPIVVRVRDFTIPVRPSLRTAFGLGPRWRISQDRDAYIRNLLEHRVSPYSVGAPTLEAAPLFDWRNVRILEARLEADRDGMATLHVTDAAGKPRCFPARRVASDAPGLLRFDLSGCRGMVRSWRLDLVGPLRAAGKVRLLFKDGKMRHLDNGERSAVFAADGWLAQWPSWSSTPWGEHEDVPARWNWKALDAALDRYVPQGLTGLRIAMRRPLAGWARAWQDHMRPKGLLPLCYTYLFDEPRPEDYPKLNRVMGEVKRAAPGLMNMMTARSFPPELHYVDIWCPELFSFDPAKAAAEQKRGRAVWWYVAFSTRHPYPNVWVDYPALDCRVWPWMTWKHDLDGMLYWSVTAWTRSDPWRSAQTFPGANGDGSLLYPGRNGKPVDSIRWECLRDGLEDYEVFCLLEAGVRELRKKKIEPDLLQKAAALLAIDDQVVHSYKSYNPDPQAYLAARADMSDLLERIVKALGHEPRITGRPRFRPGVDLAGVPDESSNGAVSAAVAATAWIWPEPHPESGLVLSYAFDNRLPFAADLSGNGMHGTVVRAKRVPGVSGQALRISEHAAVILPSGADLLGTQPAQGSIAVWARPAFAAKDVPSDQWKGYHVLFYIMQTDGNGLPDGYDEIGLYIHGRHLYARCAGRAGAFARIPSPLTRGRWTHLCLTWNRDERSLYVNGKRVVRKVGPYPLPKLDEFRGGLGCHPPHRGWPWNGDLDEFRVYRRCLSPDEIARLARRK